MLDKDDIATLCLYIVCVLTGVNIVLSSIANDKSNEALRQAKEQRIQNEKLMKKFQADYGDYNYPNSKYMKRKFKKRKRKYGI